MLRLFRNNQFYTAILVFIYALPFFISKFVNDDFLKVENAVDYTFLLAWVPNFKSLGTVAESVLLFGMLLIQAFWLNRLINVNRLGKRATYYGSVAFLLCAFSFQGSVILAPALFANLSITLSLVQLFRAYEKKSSVAEIFNAAFFASLGALLNPAAIWYLPFIVISWFMLRAFNAKELIIIFLGLTIPYYLLGTYMFAFGNLSGWWSNDVIGSFGRTAFNVNLNLSFWISLGSWALLLLISILNFNTLKQKTTIREQKYIDVLFWLLIFSGLCWIGQKNYATSDFITFALPLSIFISLNLQSFKNDRFAELLHFLLLSAAIFAQYQSYFYQGT
jgi:hypothetical protein